MLKTITSQLVDDNFTHKVICRLSIGLALVVAGIKYYHLTTVSLVYALVLLASYIFTTDFFSRKSGSVGLC